MTNLEHNKLNQNSIFAPQWPDQSKWRLYSIIGWIIWGTLLGLVTYARILDYNHDVPFWPPVLNSVFSWSIWILIVPFIFWTSHRFPLADGRWRLSLIYHLVLSLTICTAVALFHTYIGAALYTWLSNETYWQAWNNFGMPGFLFGP